MLLGNLPFDHCTQSRRVALVDIGPNDNGTLLVYHDQTIDRYDIYEYSATHVRKWYGCGVLEAQCVLYEVFNDVDRTGERCEPV
jgi:hypothetical protein